MPEMLVPLTLYSVRVGNTGSFFAAAHDATQAKAIGEQWRADHGFAESQNVAVKRSSDLRPVYTFR